MPVNLGRQFLLEHIKMILSLMAEFIFTISAPSRTETIENTSQGFGQYNLRLS